MNIDKSEVTIGIVTALSEEYQAVKAILENVKPFKEPDDPSYYAMGQIKVLDDFGGGFHKVVNVRSGMGNNASAIAASHLMRTFKEIKYLFMVGIAGGILQYVKLGDIVVAKEIVQYDYGKKDGEKFELKKNSQPASEPLLKIHDYLQDNQYPWYNHLDTIIDALSKQNSNLVFGFKHPENSKKLPNVFCETIGSANMVLKDEQFRNKLCTEYGIHAVEMEGSGIADAATMKGLPFMIIRGICDYCDKSKNDNWHGYAAAAAAAYTKALIEVLPEIKQNDLKADNNQAKISSDEKKNENLIDVEMGDIETTEELIIGGDITEGTDNQETENQLPKTNKVSATTGNVKGQKITIGGTIRKKT